MHSVGLLDAHLIQATPDLPYGMTGYIPTPKLHWSGDGRAFSDNIHASSRTHQELEYYTDTGRIDEQWQCIGPSHLMAPFDDEVTLTSTASQAGVESSLVRRGSAREVHLKVASSNPLMIGAPAIDADLVVLMDPLTRTAFISGKHDGFPAYEVYINSSTGTHRLYTYDPQVTGETPAALFPPMDKVASATTTW